MSGRTSNYLKGATILAGAGIISRLLGVFFKIPLYHMVGSYGNGLFTNVFTIYNLLLMVSTVGFPVAISKIVSENIAKGEYATAHRGFRIALLSMVALGGISTLFLLLGANAIIDMANWTSENYPAIIAIAFAPLFVTMCAAYRGFFQGFQMMTPTAISQIVEQIVRVFLGVFLCWILINYSVSLGVGGAIFGATAGALIAAILLRFLYKNFIIQNRRLLKKRTQKRQKSNKKLFMRLIIISIPVTLTSALVAMFSVVDSFIYTPRLAVAGFSAHEATVMIGDFSNAEILINIPLVLSGTLAVAMIPAISESFAVRNRREMNEKILLAIRIILLVAFPACIGLSVLSQGIFDLLFAGSPYGGDILRTFSYATIFMMLSNTFQSILQAIDRFRIPLINLGLAIVIRFISGWIFMGIPFLNIQGIVLSSILTFGYLTVANFISVKRYTQLKIDYFHTLLKPLIASAVMGPITYLTFIGIRSFLDPLLGATIGLAVGLAVAIIIAICVYGVIMILLQGITEEEINYFPGRKKLMKLYHAINDLFPGRKKQRLRKLKRERQRIKGSK